MTARAPEALCDPVLVSLGVAHGFGRRGSQVPDSTWFPRQVHGAGTVRVDDPQRDAVGSRHGDRPDAGEADAIATTRAGRSVGIVTADCVPILAARADGSAVAAIHAGWRGLAAGVVEAGLTALAAGRPSASLLCAVGPAARGCCYEVDEPVRAALEARYPAGYREGFSPGRRAGHFQLDLALLATRVVEAWLGPQAAPVGIAHRVCTICDPERFESHRRDGARSGRLRHFIVCPGSTSRRG